jgi:Na+/phosphate symporter
MKDSVQISLERIIRLKFRNIENAKKNGEIKNYLAKINKSKLSELSRKEGIELISIISSI